jgi:hypothetical protein
MRPPSAIAPRATASTGLIVSPVEFADIMKASGFKKKTVDGKVYWLGIGLTIDSAQSDGKSRASN